MKNHLIIELKHLRQIAQASQKFAATVAGVAADAIEELDRKKQNKLTGSIAQVVGFNASGQPVAVDAEWLPLTGGTLTGDLRIQGIGKNYGNKINLGDGDYVHLSEPTDDCLEIKAKKINFLVSDTTDAQFTLNGSKIGATGPAGAAAGFGTPTATVDTNTGTPNVIVTASGPDTAKVFNFVFKNLKGSKGDKGDTGTQGPKGEKGDPGISVTGTSGQVVGFNASGQPTAENARWVPLAGGTMTGSLNMGAKKVTNLGAPTANTDATNKKYVDDAIQDALGSIEEVLKNI